MTQLIIPNHIDGKIKWAQLDLETGKTVFDDGRVSNKEEILKPNETWYHPILEIPPLDVRNDTVSYEETNSEISRIISRIYPTFLHHKNPGALTFSWHSKKDSDQNHEAIYFSSKKNEVATKSISPQQLSAMISHLTVNNFFYSNTISISARLSLATLPEKVNADQLFEQTIDMVQIPDMVPDISSFELRFISHQVGFGVYARQRFDKDTALFLYTGQWTHQSEFIEYRFKDEDVFNLSIDAKHQGNLARFINHADQSYSNPLYQGANVYSKFHQYNGLGLIMIYAKRNILPGEQLLMNYNCTLQDIQYDVCFCRQNELYKLDTGTVPTSKKDQQVQAFLDAYPFKSFESILQRSLFVLVIFLLIGLGLKAISFADI